LIKASTAVVLSVYMVLRTRAHNETTRGAPNAANPGEVYIMRGQ